MVTTLTMDSLVRWWCALSDMVTTLGIDSLAIAVYTVTDTGKVTLSHVCTYTALVGHNP